jgi:thiamine-phosphate pyrophosphorylase
MPSLPKVYPLTDRTLSGLSQAEQVARLIDGGATLIQLREKYLAANEFLREVEAAWKIADANGAKLIINDRADIALAVDAAGVHLGQNDFPVIAARNLLRESSIIGLSTHTLKDIETAVLLPIDYVAFGPLFATRTKTNHEPTVGLEQLPAAKKTAGDLPLVAIGGVTAENCRIVLEAGADSVAVIAALLAEPTKIAQNMRRMLELTAG